MRYPLQRVWLRLFHFVQHAIDGSAQLIKSIVAGGFGGLRAAQVLKSELVDVTSWVVEELRRSIKDVDSATKQVFFADGAVLSYDSLIVATGSQTSYFGHNEWQEWAPGLKSIEKATTIRHKIPVRLRGRRADPDPVQRRAWLSFVIVGQARRVWNLLERFVTDWLPDRWKAAQKTGLA